VNEFAESFDARLLALARTQELLTQGSAVCVRLDDTIRQELTLAVDVARVGWSALHRLQVAIPGSG
jgi:hypothetical protein